MAQSPYVGKYYTLRKWVKFPFRKEKGKDFSPAQKAIISRYFNAARQYGIIGKTRPDLFLYSSKSPKLLAQAKEAAGNEPGFPLFKVAIFDGVPEGAVIRPRKQNGKYVFAREGKYRREQIYLFADYENYPGEFVEHPQTVTRRILKLIKSAHAVRLLTGEWLTVSTRSPALLLDEITRYTNAYGPTQRKPGDVWHEWLRGILAIWFVNQKQKAGYYKTMQTRKGRQSQLTALGL